MYKMPVYFPEKVFQRIFFRGHYPKYINLMEYKSEDILVGTEDFKL